MFAPFVRIVISKIKFFKNDTVLDGLYSWDEYLTLKESFGDSLKMISIVNDKNIRYDRVGRRDIRPFDRDNIIKRDVSEIENLAKGGPIAYADYFILNNGTIDQYIERLEEILKDIRGE